MTLLMVIFVATRSATILNQEIEHDTVGFGVGVLEVEAVTGISNCKHHR